MAIDPHAPRPVNQQPPRYARAWCPQCRHWLEAQFARPPVPDYLVCHGCHKQAFAASGGHYPLKGSYPATPVWEG